MRRLSLFALILALLVSGCALMALSLEKPDVSLVGIELGQTSLLEQHLKLTLKVTNPNDREIAVDGMNFRVEVGDQELVHGVTNKTVVLPRLGEVRFPVDTSVSLAGILKRLPALLGGGLSYRLRGEVFTRDFGRLPFDRKGELGGAKKS